MIEVRQTATFVRWFKGLRDSQAPSATLVTSGMPAQGFRATHFLGTWLQGLLRRARRGRGG